MLNSVFDRLKSKPFVRVSLLMVCVLFLIGGAVNDGFTAWFWSLPFLYIFYKLLSDGVLARRIICLAILATVIIISNLKWTSQIIFPVIGQKVKFSVDIPTTTFQDDGATYYDENPNFRPECVGVGCGTLSYGFISGGSIFTVKRIKVTHPEFGNELKFILSDGKNELIVANYALADNSIIEKAENSRTFCEMVEWEFCSEMKNYNTDPMRPTFRWLASLMYYPVFPLAILAFLKN